jgi:2-polyprenyl-3-methyl-5-hydroxy-6-metoxy-1,4-benzoquinol methylase
MRRVTRILTVVVALLASIAAIAMPQRRGARRSTASGTVSRSNAVEQPGSSLTAGVEAPPAPAAPRQAGIRADVPRLAVNDGLVDVNCPLCGGADHALYTMAPSHYGPERFRVTRCRECRMIFTNPQPTTYIQEVADRGVLGRHFDEGKLASRRRVASFVLSVLAPLSPGRRILDFGCGEGAFVAQAVAEGWEASGVDLNAGLVEHARRHWGIETLVGGSLEEFLAANPQPYDAIVTSQVFEHLQEPRAMGAALVAMLKPGGVIYIDVPNANQLGEWVQRGKTLDPTAHWNHFTVKTLERLVRDLGCDVVHGTAAPSLVGVYRRVGFDQRTANALGRVSRRTLPGIGTGACVIGRRPTSSMAV